MFRLFLMNKLASEEKAEARPKLPSKQYRNRRLYERFNIDRKHIALLNEQDILNIRDISTSGFSCEVAERCLERLKVGDRYVCRIRYLSEVFDLTAQVAWKAKPFVGFSIHEASVRITHFLSRIITPARVGASLRPLDESLRKLKGEVDPLQFHGEESHLTIWENKAQDLESWCLEYRSKYIQWDRYKGVETGKLDTKKESSLGKPWEKRKNKDEKPDSALRQFALDVFMVLDFARSENLIESLQKKT